MSSMQIALHDTHVEYGASFTDWLGWRVPEHFGNVETEYGHAGGAAVVVDRSYRAALEVSGKDVTSFLSGIVSSETERLGIGEGQASLFLNAKGKVLGAFQTYRTAEDRCLLRVIEPLRDALVQNLTKYAFLSDIEVKPVNVATISLYGPRSTGLLRDRLGIDADVHSGMRHLQAYGSVELAVYRADDVSVDGFDIEMPSDALGRVWGDLAAAVTEVGGSIAGHAVGEILRVEAGVPVFGLDYDDSNFPAEAGLDGALSYDKCYVGQEVVARMRTYGHANRKLRGLRFSQKAPAAGTMIRIEDRDLARLTSPVHSPRCGPIALGLVGRRFWTSENPLRVETEAGNMDIDLVDLPFVKSPSK